MNSIFSRTNVYRAFKFSAAGVLIMLLVLVLMYLFTDVLGFHYIVSSVFVLLISLTINYFINNFWAFGDRKNDKHYYGWGKFLIVTGVETGMYFGLLIGFTEWLGMYYLLSVILAVLIRFPVKYVLCCWWVFPNRETIR